MAERGPHKRSDRTRPPEADRTAYTSRDASADVPPAERLGVLVRRAQRGDSAALHALTEEAQRRLRPYFYKHLADPDLAEELLQETLLHLLQSLSRLRRPEVFWPWVYRIAANQIRTHYRRQGRHATIRFSSLEPHRLESLLGRADRVEQATIRREIVARIEQALSGLKELPQRIMHLRCRQGLSYRQIGARLGCTEISARAHFSRARRRLRRQLAVEGIAGP